MPQVRGGRRFTVDGPVKRRVSRRTPSLFCRLGQEHRPCAPRRTTGVLVNAWHIALDITVLVPLMRRWRAGRTFRETGTRAPAGPSRSTTRCRDCRRKRWREPGAPWSVAPRRVHRVDGALARAVRGRGASVRSRPFSGGAARAARVRGTDGRFRAGVRGERGGG